ncbi:MAG TPA: DUF5916 domain-containing protein [Candidatus Eisenbacteria bacterium]
MDGDIGDSAWASVPVIDTWFETNVGDNVEPQVKNRARLAYDDHFLYAAFEFGDPNPGGIRAPLGDHDAVGGSTDYAGLIIDSRNDAKTARMFLANPRGVQYDAVTSDVSGEDSSPDFYWDSAGKITESGWTLELRIPFSSLRYSDTEAPTWGMLMYRNYPRDRRYQFFSARLPRDVNCFICNSSKMTGLSSLPQGSHLVVAPFVTGTQESVPKDGLGTALESGDLDGEAGVDIKWSPASTVALDATVNPDFSQVESDVAQIAANERFALFFPEKRPFFLEGVDLFSTPMQAVYTRTVTSPSAGLRATGRMGETSYTVLATHDEGDGTVIIPGAQGSEQVSQDFQSGVGIARVRRDLGQSFVSVLATSRLVEGGGYNHVFGPDFQWRPNPRDNFTGQLLFSETETPDRQDLSEQWDGRKLSDVAGLLYWSHGTRHEDVFVQLQSLGEDFRADNGFIPQVGYSEGYFEAGYTIRPTDFFLNRIRPFTIHYVDIDTDGEVLSQRSSFGTGMDGRWNSFLRYELNWDAMRVGDELLRRFRPRIQATAVPGRVVNSLAIDTYFGEEIDFANAREGTGVTLAGSFILRPSHHLELRGNLSYRWLNVDEPTLSGRVFTAEVERLRATWAFNSRSFLRLIGQYTETTRNPELYDNPVSKKSANFGGSALFAYKINWQTVLYAGYGDQHDYLGETDSLEPSGQQFFTKVSYAWQH